MRWDWILILVLLAGCGAAGYAFYADLAGQPAAERQDEAGAATEGNATAQVEAGPRGAHPIRYPLWDKKEDIDSYAKRSGLPPEIAFDLGDGVRLEMVLIPAGKAELGTPEPDRPAAVWRGSLAFLCGVVAFALTILGSVLHARRNNTRLQFSLRWLLLMASAASMALIGALHWRELAQRHEVYANQLKLWHAASARTEEFETPFYLAKYETTNAQYAQAASRFPFPPANNPAPQQPAPDRSQPDSPVVWVQMEHCYIFAEALERILQESEKIPEGFEVSFPTQGVWEYACRAGRSTIYSGGDRTEDLDAIAWWSGNSGGELHPVGRKAPNAFGLYDMHGNAAETCRSSVTGTRSGQIDPLEVAVRGGSFESDAFNCAVSVESGIPTYRNSASIGFRVVLDGPRTKEQRAAFLEWLDALKKKDAAPPAPAP